MVLWGLRWRLISLHTAPSTKGLSLSARCYYPARCFQAEELSRKWPWSPETHHPGLWAGSKLLHPGSLCPTQRWSSTTYSTALLSHCHPASTQTLVPCSLTHILFQTTEPCWKLNKHHVPAFPRHLFCKYLLSTDDMERTGWPEINQM